MKKSRFTEEQIVFALKQAELGTSVPDVCRKLGISDATFYTLRKKYGGISPSELKHMRQLEEENLRLQASRASGMEPAGPRQRAGSVHDSPSH
jgi:putative transposase